MPNTQNLKPFQEGDSCIKRRRHPCHYDLFRTIAREISNELVTDEISGELVTRIEVIIRDWAASKEVQKQLAFAEHSFGKVPKNENSVRDVNIVVDWSCVVDGPYHNRSVYDYLEDLDPQGRPALPVSA